MTLNSHTLEKGVQKTSVNARDLVNAAIALRSSETISNNLGYGILFMQTGLEEAAKASFLFENYITSLTNGQMNVSNKNWKHWMGGRGSHAKRVARVQYLYALTAIEGGMLNTCKKC